MYRLSALQQTSVYDCGDVQREGVCEQTLQGAGESVYQTETIWQISEHEHVEIFF